MHSRETQKRQKKQNKIIHLHYGACYDGLPNMKRCDVILNGKRITSVNVYYYQFVLSCIDVWKWRREIEILWNTFLQSIVQLKRNFFEFFSTHFRFLSFPCPRSVHEAPRQFVRNWTLSANSFQSERLKLDATINSTFFVVAFVLLATRKFLRRRSIFVRQHLSPSF